MASNPSVIVIGGGLAGCSAALALARAGVRVQLFEARSRLGGRVGSTTDPVSGQKIDYCQHVGMACCSSLIKLIEWLDQNQLWHRQRELYFYGSSGERQTLRALPLVPAPFHLGAWLFRWPGLTTWDRLGIARAMRALNRIAVPNPSLDAPFPSCLERLTPEVQRLDEQSALEWLVVHGQSETALRRFWSTIVVSALGEELSRVGLLAMAQVFQDGFLRQRDAFHLLVPQRPLDDLLGSRFQAKLIDSGVEVMTGLTVVEMNWNGSTCNSVVLSNGRRLHADRFVIAVPWHGVQRLMRDCLDTNVRSIAAGAAQLESSPISGVHTWWDRPWLPTSHAVLVDGLCQWIFPLAQRAAASADESRQAYYQIVISASRMLPRSDNEALRSLIFDDLATVFPEARRAQLLRVKAVTDPQAVFAVAPGTSALRPALGSCNGNLYWAGDWVRSGWPATMEGAIRSGFAAAAAIASSVSVR